MKRFYYIFVLDDIVELFLLPIRKYTDKLLSMGKPPDFIQKYCCSCCNCCKFVVTVVIRCKCCKFCCNFVVTVVTD